MLSGDRGWKLGCWGDFSLTAPDGADATPRSRKARALVAWLAFHPDRPASRERLAGLLWGDRAEEQARASLRQVLFEIRPLCEGEAALVSFSRAAVTLHGRRLSTDLANTDLRHLPHEDEPLFANLDDIDESFDNWLRVARERERQLLERPAAGWPSPEPVAVAGPAVSGPARASGRNLLRAVGAILLLGIAFALVRWNDAPLASPISLAVLPF